MNYLVEIDGELCQSKMGFMKEMDSAFGFPPYFGENWDALWDCMRDMYWIKETKIILTIKNSEFLYSKLKHEIRVFFDDLKNHLIKINSGQTIRIEMI